MARSKRQGTLSLKQVLEQLQHDSDSAKDFDLEEDKNAAERIIKIDPIVSEILMF